MTKKYTFNDVLREEGKFIYEGLDSADLFEFYSKIIERVRVLNNEIPLYIDFDRIGNFDDSILNAGSLTGKIYRKKDD